MRVSLHYSRCFFPLFYFTKIGSQNHHTLHFWKELISHYDHVTTHYTWKEKHNTPGFSELPVDIIYMEWIEKMQMELKAFNVTVSQNNVHEVDEITNNIEMSLDRHSSRGERYSLTAELNRKLNIIIEKLPIWLMHLPPLKQCMQMQSKTLYNVVDLKRMMILIFCPERQSYARNDLQSNS